MLPAKHGDALVVSYGPGLSYRMAIDAGPASAWDDIRTRLDRSLSDRRIVDLMVVTHVDTDHIEGVLMLLRDESLGVKFGDIWFNDYEHLLGDRPRGGVQGAYLGALLSTKPWNEAWDCDAVRIYDDGSLPAFRAGDDPASESFTLLSPTRDKARRMARAWSAECAKRKLPLDRIDEILERLEDDARYRGLEVEGRRAMGHDGSAPNGSSIAFVFEVDDKSVLFTGDAHASVLVDSLQRLCHDRNVERLRVDAFKLSHHGSRGNITEALLELVDCDTFLVSTNGDKFGHPDPETIDLIAKHAPRGRRPTIWFNYDCPSTAMYRERSDIKARYGKGGYLKLDL
jgi:beta-lactamase superfamily II metal-dependent hydrolase